MNIACRGWKKGGIILFLVIVCGLFCLEQERRIWACRNRMIALKSTFQGYRNDHNWNYPPDLASSASWMFDGASLSTNEVKVLLSCPGVGVDRRELRDITDYTYINWQKLLGTNAVPGEYPLIYDGKLSNHLGLGINILPVSGKCFWDFRARWLKSFIDKHPEYHLSVPQ